MQNIMIAANMTSVEIKVVIADGLESANLDGETVLLDINSGHYFGLNEVGSRIVQLASSPITVSEIVKTMLSEYDVEAERLERDVSSFIGQMVDRKLIRQRRLPA